MGRVICTQVDTEHEGLNDHDKYNNSGHRRIITNHDYRIGNGYNNEDEKSARNRPNTVYYDVESVDSGDKSVEDNE